MRSSFTRAESSWKVAAIVGFIQSRIAPTLKVAPSRSSCSRLLQCCYNKYLSFRQWGKHSKLGYSIHPCVLGIPPMRLGLFHPASSTRLFHPRTTIAALRLEGAMLRPQALNVTVQVKGARLSRRRTDCTG